MNYPIVAIDPSVRNLGVAVLPTPDISSLVTFTVSAGYEQGVEKLMYPVWAVLSSLKVRKTIPKTLIIEYPTFQTSTRGKIAAQKGYLIDLGFVIGGIVQAFKNAEILLPSPYRWKGNTPKHVVGNRFTAWTGRSTLNLTDHEYEAAMMIKWALKEYESRKTN